MVQLTRDEDLGELLSLEACLAEIKTQIAPLDAKETLPLLAALNHVSAQAIHAPIALPPFYNSAVDGYAVRFEELTQAFLPIKARIAAGDALFAHAPFTATRIFTGAPMPLGADTVFMQEDVRVENGAVFLPKGLKKGANTRPIGEDIAQGALALAKGELLTARHLALLASLGITTVAVAKPLRVGVFSTGNEIITPPTLLVTGKIFDANRVLLLSLLQNLNIDTLDLGIMPDNEALMTQKLQESAQHCDVLLTSGGVSTGEEDHVKTALQRIGTLNFWRLGIKPGRPVAIGKINETHFLGLPGNPVAAFVTFMYVVRPILAQLRGETYQPPQSYPLISAFDYKKKAGRREYVRVTIHNNEVHKFSREGAGVITSLTQTHGLVELPENLLSLKKGDVVNFIPYS